MIAEMTLIPVDNALKTRNIAFRRLTPNQALSDEAKPSKPDRDDIADGSDGEKTIGCFSGLKELPFGTPP